METSGKQIELKDLWRRYKQDGDNGARERLVVAYSPMVKFVAGRLGAGLPSHVDDADLISYGLMGLIGAIERFDPDRGIKFETFAMTRIRGAIIDELRSLDWVPRSVRSRAREIEKAQAKLEHELQRAPTDAEVASTQLLLADTLLVSRRRDEAIDAYRRVVRRSARFPEAETAEFTIGQLLYERGSAAEAASAFEGYLAHYAHGRFAREAREHLARIQRLRGARAVQ